MKQSVLFGRGQGESVLVQLSEDDWMIVDSCTNDNKEPAAIRYLIDIGKNPADVVKLIVISHFHNDHIKGMSKIIDICTKADVCISSALNTFEFHAYLSAISSPDINISQTSEMKAILNQVGLFKGPRKLRFAIADRHLYKNGDVSVVSLSPCDNDIKESDSNFASLLEVNNKMSDVSKSAALINPNHYSIVLRIFDDKSQSEMLLGADLEVSKTGGWDEVCNCNLSPKPNRVNVFKIPHHGSITGFHEPTWQHLINSSPECVMTTFNTHNLPTPEMQEKYKVKAKNLYCASTPKNYTPPENLREIVKTLSKTKSTVKFLNKNSKFGYIQIQNYLCSSPTIEIFGDAKKIA